MARLREDQCVLGQFATNGRLAHPREEPRPELRRLPEHVDEHEPVCGAIAHLRQAGNAFPLEDGPGLGEHRGVLALVVGCQERVDESLDALGQRRVPAGGRGLSHRAASGDGHEGHEEDPGAAASPHGQKSSSI